MYLCKSRQPLYFTKPIKDLFRVNYDIAQRYYNNLKPLYFSFPGETSATYVYAVETYQPISFWVEKPPTMLHSIFYGPHESK
jgi:hypothetical protein